MFSPWLQSTRYAQVPQNAIGNETSEMGGNPSVSVHTQRKNLLSLGCLIFISLLFGLTGFATGVKVAQNHCGLPILAGTVPQVPIGCSRETFRYNDSFARLVPISDGSEPIWDSLMPNGLGYIKYPTLTPNLSVISAFHQLHCLYTLRRTYYSISKPGELEGFDFGLNRTLHTNHCFEYLRQSIMCSADPSIEPAGTRVEGFLGWGFKRQCRNFVELKDWAEKTRAFEGHGFLAVDIVHNHPS